MRHLLLAILVCVAASSYAAPQPSGKDAQPHKAGRAQVNQTAPVPTPPKHVPIARPTKQERVETPLHKQPCRNTPEDRQSDLCAQWEAADATRDTAWWAMVGTLVAIIGTAGLWSQIWLTRKSLDVAMADRRPSVYPDKVTFKIEGKTLKGQISVKNFGQSEARDVAITAAASFGPYPLPDDPPPLRSKAVASGKMPPGTLRYQYVERGDLGKWHALVTAEKAAFLISGHISYKDQFGRPYSERFDYFTTGKDFDLGALRICDPWKADEKPESPDANEPELGLEGGGPKEA